MSSLFWKTRDSKQPLNACGSSGSGISSSIGDDEELVVEQTFKADSKNAQSGVAVSQASNQTETELNQKYDGALKYKGTKGSFDELPSSNNEFGDVYNVSSDNANYVWSGNEWDKLSEDLSGFVSTEQIEQFNSNLESHKNNSDEDCHHLSQEELQKFRSMDIYSSSDIQTYVDDSINEYITNGDIVTKDSMTHGLEGIAESVESTIIEEVVASMSGNYLTNEGFEEYKTEINNTISQFIKCEESDEIKVFFEGDTIPPLSERDANVIYIISGKEIYVPEHESQSLMTLVIETTEPNQKVNIGYQLGSWDPSGYSPEELEVSGTVDWGDGPVNITGTEGYEDTDNNSLIHTYQDVGTHKIKVGGKVRWNVPKKSNTDSLKNFLTKIEIASGDTSPIYDILSNGFGYYNKLTSIPKGLLDNCTNTTIFTSLFRDTVITSIPDGLFSHCTNAEKFTGVFQNCTGIIQIPSDLFANCTKAHDFKQAFYNTNITQIPPDLFKDCTSYEGEDNYSFEKCFMNSKITSIPESLFNTITKQLRTLDGCFQNTPITSIPQNLLKGKDYYVMDSCFDSCTEVTGKLPELWNEYKYSSQSPSYTRCFCGCEKAENYSTAVEQGWACEKSTTPVTPTEAQPKMVLTIETTEDNQYVNFAPTFYVGTQLINRYNYKGGTIDWGDGKTYTYNGNEYKGDGNSLDHLFAKKGTHTVTITGELAWCKGVKASSTAKHAVLSTVLTKIEIPEGCTSPLVLPCSWGDDIFANHTKLTEIPSNLFDNARNATSLKDVGSMFSYCSSLKEIPSGLFDVFTNLTSFELAFRDCTSLVTIPSELFAKNTKVTTFLGVFKNCSKLSTIPQDLFSKNLEVTTFSSAFSYCSTLSAIPESLFTNNKKVTSFSQTFEYCENVGGKLPELWNTHKTATYHSDCFKKCSKASNYSTASDKGWA